MGQTHGQLLEEASRPIPRNARDGVRAAIGVVAHASVQPSDARFVFNVANSPRARAWPAPSPGATGGRLLSKKQEKRSEDGATATYIRSRRPRRPFGFCGETRWLSECT